MGFAMASLLAHSEHVPAAARDAIKAAQQSAREHRTALLETAARILYVEGGVECSDARELLDLQPGCCAG